MGLINQPISIGINAYARQMIKSNKLDYNYKEDMAQSYYKLYYHIIWGTKHRLSLITPEIELLINQYLPNKVIEYEGQQLALNMVVLSLSERGIPFVKEYIIKQKQRHADKDLINVLEYTPKEDK